MNADVVAENTDRACAYADECVADAEAAMTRLAEVRSRFLRQLFVNVFVPSRAAHANQELKAATKAVNDSRAKLEYAVTDFTRLSEARLSIIVAEAKALQK